MGQIVIYFLLIKKMLYICIAAAPMLQGCDFFGVTIWQFDLSFSPDLSPLPKIWSVYDLCKLYDNLTHIKAKWQFDPYF